MNIASINTESKLANSIIKSLATGYKLSTDKDQMKFLHLSVYLLALGLFKESNDIARFIASNCEYDGNENVWNSVGHQQLLCAYFESLNGNTAKCIELTNVVVKCDILSESLSKSDYLAEKLEEYAQEVEFLLTETPKWRCQGLVYLFIELNYCLRFAEATLYEIPKNVAFQVEPLMTKTLELLKNELKS